MNTKKIIQNLQNDEYRDLLLELFEVMEYEEEMVSEARPLSEMIAKDEIGKVFVKVLECAGVYKNTEEGRKAFLKFINTL